MKEDIDVKAVADEVKKFLESKKFDLVDYSLVEIEAYPPPKDSKYPTVKKLSKAWETFFSASDKALHHAPNNLMGKPFVITAISSGPESLIGDTPTLRNQGVKWFLYYSIILVLVHHASFFYLEIFRIREFAATFVRMLLSSAFTMVLVLISEYLLYPRGK